MIRRGGGARPCIPSAWRLGNRSRSQQGLSASTVSVYLVADEAEFDARKFLEDLARSGAEHAQVVAARPGAPELADSMKTLAGLLYEFLDAYRVEAAEARGEQPEQTYEWYPLAGSTCEADYDWLQPYVLKFCADQNPVSLQWLDTNPTRNPSAWRVDHLKRCLHTVIDNLSA
jgi:hypothetical protein